MTKGNNTRWEGNETNKAFLKTNYLNCSTDDKRSKSKVQILKLYGQACRRHQQATNGHFILLSKSTISTNSVQSLIAPAVV